MIKSSLLLAGLFLIPACLVAQPPLISPRAVVNAASFMSPGLPSGAIAQGSIFTIFGVNIGPASSPPLAFPLSTNLGGVSIKIIQGNTSVDGFPIFVSPTQVNAIMPSNAPLGMASVQITFNNNPKTNMAPVRIVSSSVGVFAIRAGIGPGIFFNFLAQDNQPLNSPAVPATPGQVITLYGTGLGPAVGFADNIAPPAVKLPIATEVFVGGKSAIVAY